MRQITTIVLLAFTTISLSQYHHRVKIPDNESQWKLSYVLGAGSTKNFVTYGLVYGADFIHYKSKGVIGFGLSSTNFVYGLRLDPKQMKIGYKGFWGGSFYNLGGAVAFELLPFTKKFDLQVKMDVGGFTADYIRPMNGDYYRIVTSGFQSGVSTSISTYPLPKLGIGLSYNCAYGFYKSIDSHPKSNKEAPIEFVFMHEILFSGLSFYLRRIIG